MNQPADGPGSDAALLGRLDLAKVAQWSELERGIGPLRDIRAVPWTSPGKRDDGVLRIPHPQYPPLVGRVSELLYEIGVITPAYQWMDQEPPRPGGDGTIGAADAVRLLTTVVRGERFGDGCIAKALENGSFAVAVQALITWRRSTSDRKDHTVVSTPNKRPATGALIGSAIGDALGQPTEFFAVERIEAEYGPWRQMRFPVRHNGVALVTDDTEMTLAVARALRDAQEAGGLSRPEPVTDALIERFSAWLDHPGIAPGNTCMTACRALRKGNPWAQATIADSKGCGANMRVAPVALVPGPAPHHRALLAQLQSALTHGHPTALAASDLTAYAIRLLAHGTAPALLPELMLSYARASVLVPPPGWDQWLGDLAPQGAAYVDGGWQECISVLERLAAAAAPGGVDPEADPCLATGAGWIAEEALATGLLCFLLFPDDPVAAVRRAACTSGDSDSIAALTGAFAGAHHGIAAWPPEWISQVEHSTELLALGGVWDEGA